MKPLFIVCIILHLIILVVGPPVVPKKEKQQKVETDEKNTDDMNLGLEYERYLKEVVAVLEKDEGFRSKIENANSSDIKSGKIAKHLQFVSHEVRSKLDELKRSELDRLRMLLKQKAKLYRATGDKKDLHRMKFDPRTFIGHMDHENPESFGTKDLENLIKKATVDLELIDKKREEEFKKYEMEKEHLRREQLKQLDEEKRKEEQRKFEEAQKKHKDHPKLHEPGHKAQVEEVWEEDHEEQEFNPKTFFFEHDLNGDKQLDEEEIEALFLKELEKMYNESEPEDDINEKYEEMYRMRIKVVNEIDTDKDKFISLQEWLDFTSKDEFAEDEGWKGLDEEEIFSEEELQEFEDEYAKEFPPGEKPPTLGTTPPAPVEHKESEPVENRNQIPIKINPDEIKENILPVEHNPPPQVLDHQNADKQPLVNNMEQPAN